MPLETDATSGESWLRCYPYRRRSAEFAEGHERVEHGVVFVQDPDAPDGGLAGHVEVRQGVENATVEDRVVDAFLLFSFYGVNEFTAFHTIVHDTKELLSEFDATLSEDIRYDGDARASEGLQTRGLEEEDLREGVVATIKVCAEGMCDEAEATCGEHFGEERDLPIELLSADEIMRQVRWLESEAVAEDAPEQSIDTASPFSGEGPRKESVGHDWLDDGAEELPLDIHTHVAVPDAVDFFHSSPCAALLSCKLIVEVECPHAEVAVVIGEGDSVVG